MKNWIKPTKVNGKWKLTGVLAEHSDLATKGTSSSTWPLIHLVLDCSTEIALCENMSNSRKSFAQISAIVVQLVGLMKREWLAWIGIAPLIWLEGPATRAPGSRGRTDVVFEPCGSKLWMIVFFIRQNWTFLGLKYDVLGETGTD
jgi:hypothetical protein